MGGIRARKGVSTKCGGDESLGRCVVFLGESALDVKNCRKLWVGSELRLFGGLDIAGFWGSGALGYSGLQKQRKCLREGERGWGRCHKWKHGLTFFKSGHTHL